MTHPRNVLQKSRHIDFLSTEGSGIAIVLVIMAVSSISMMGMLGIANIRQRAQAQSTVPYQVQLLRGNVINLLKNDAALKNSASASQNSSMQCIALNTPCTVSGVPSAAGKQNQIISVILNPIDSSGLPTYKLNTATWTSNEGFTSSGQQCSSYPSEACPISLQVTWSCNGSCDSWPYNLSFTVKADYKPLIPNPSGSGYVISPRGIILNTARYDLLNIAKTDPNTYFDSP